MTDTSTTSLFTDLLARWDRQQTVYLRERERAFEVMLACLDELFVGPIRVLDLACGPGSASARVLAHRADAACVALDVDPVLHAIGRGALGDAGGRLQWVNADLRNADWHRELTHQSFDAVISTTALHWLSAAELTSVYSALTALLRPGAALLNFDGFRLTDGQALTRTVKALDTKRQQVALDEGSEGWQDWWDSVRSLGVLDDEFVRRDEIFAPATGQVFSGADRKQGSTSELHAAVLEAVGFAEVGCIWQDLHKKILLAVR